MSTLVWNLFLAFIWSAATGQFTLGGFVQGFVLGYGMLLLSRSLQPRPMAYFRRVWLLLDFMGFFLLELVISNLRVAYDVITPKHRPGIIAVPLDAKTDEEITLLANLLSLTPGTLSLDVSDDRRVLYVHAMFVVDPAQLCREIKDGYERRVLQLLR